jgi:hypothetical protein
MWSSSASSLIFSQGRRLFSSAQRHGQFFPSMPQGYKIKRFYKRVEVIEHPLSEDYPKLTEKLGFKNLS